MISRAPNGLGSPPSSSLPLSAHIESLLGQLYSMPTALFGGWLMTSHLKILGSPLELRLPCHSFIQRPLGPSLQGLQPSIHLSSAAFHDSFSLTLFMPAKPRPRGWYCQVLLLAQAVGWPHGSTAVCTSGCWARRDAFLGRCFHMAENLFSLGFLHLKEPRPLKDESPGWGFTLLMYFLLSHCITASVSSVILISHNHSRLLSTGPNILLSRNILWQMN